METPTPCSVSPFPSNQNNSPSSSFKFQITHSQQNLQAEDENAAECIQGGFMIRRSRMYTGGFMIRRSRMYTGGFMIRRSRVYTGGFLIRRSRMYTGGFTIRRSRMLVDRWQHCLNILTAAMSDNGMWVKVWLVAWRSCGCVERRLLASSHLSVCPHVSVGLCVNGFVWNFVLGILWKSVDKIEISLISKKISALYIKPSVRLIVVADSKWPQTVLLQWSGIRQFG